MKLLVKKNIVNKSPELNANDKPNYCRQKIMEYKDNVKNIQKLSIETNCAKKPVSRVPSQDTTSP